MLTSPPPPRIRVPVKVVPHPEFDLPGFKQLLTNFLNEQPAVYSLTAQAMCPWIDVEGIHADM